VLVVERDELTEDASERPGVPQGGQPHVLLHRGLLAIEGLLPGLRQELIAAGGIPMDTGELAWLSPDGWLPTDRPIFEIVSISRPLLELTVRRRVSALPGIQLRTGARVSGIQPLDGRWEIRTTAARSGGLASEPEETVTADLVVDASGRSSRLPHWLSEIDIAVPEPTIVEAQLGYATRRYRSRDSSPLDVGILIAATPESERGALALPVENGEWLVGAAGFGDRRPGRDVAEFDAYLRSLPDPALADLTAMLEPVGDVRVYRQTANRRHNYSRIDHWPAGLLVVGDALTSFNPVYGQGITVSACQAELLGAALGGSGAGRSRAGSSDEPLTARDTVRLQRQLATVAELPWSIATSEDVRYPSCEQNQTIGQRLIYRWSHRANQLAAADHPYCRVTLGSIYHLMAPARLLFGPRMAAPVIRSLVTGVPPAASRPAVLDALIPASR
jgi:2-polyprenyl-6-methoxyphenol hydroxylase-like FAD-dependent oxidoreductase